MASLRFQKIDDTTRELHSYLTAEDRVLYLREFTSRKGFGFSDTNKRISNLKKKRTDGGYSYKADAIASCAAEMQAAIPPSFIAKATIVPVPPSKVATDPGYDDRMLQVCRGIVARAGAGDVREIVKQIVSTAAAHELGDRPRPRIDDLVANYEIDETVAEPAPSIIAIVDDVLTSGTHFKAMQRVLRRRYPSVQIIGLFIARRVFAEPAAADFGFEALD